VFDAKKNPKSFAAGFFFSEGTEKNKRDRYRCPEL
jgi:hypothetical protein